MPNRLLERLGADYQQLFSNFDDILNRCAAEGRDPTDAEQGILDGLKDQMDPLGERIVELRSIEDRRHSTVAALTDLPERETPTGERLGVVQVRSETEIYRKPDASLEIRQSFFRDMLHAQRDGDMEARSRLERHTQMATRAASTTGGSGGTIPPTWLFEEFALIAHGARPTADTLRRIGITDANPVTVGVQSAPGAVVGVQATENAVPVDGSFTSTPLVVTPSTYTGKVDVSRQMIDGSNPAVDSLVYTDVMGAYNEQIETAVWTAMNALVAGNIAAAVTVDMTTAPPQQLPDGVIIAGTNVRMKRKMAPSVVFMSENTWGNAMMQKDTQGRPIVVANWAGPMNARGLGDALLYNAVAGQIAGVPVVPTWIAGDIAYVVKADDALLLESSTFNFRYEEVLGPESIRLGVWGYAGVVLSRYPMAWARITVVPPTVGLP
ncbi:MAG TPA: phage major capsid protein, partial [Acidimicrobiales bacterium]